MEVNQLPMFTLDDPEERELVNVAIRTSAGREEVREKIAKNVLGEAAYLSTLSPEERRERILARAGRDTRRLNGKSKVVSVAGLQAERRALK